MIKVVVPEGDLAPAVTLKLLEKDGNPLQGLQVSDAVVFNLSKPGYSYSAGASVSQADANATRVTYQWQAGDTDLPSGDLIGVWEASFTVTTSGGLRTFPEREAIVVVVYRKPSG